MRVGKEGEIGLTASSDLDVLCVRENQGSIGGSLDGIVGEAEQNWCGDFHNGLTIHRVPSRGGEAGCFSSSGRFVCRLWSIAGHGGRGQQQMREP